MLYISHICNKSTKYLSDPVLQKIVSGDQIGQNKSHHNVKPGYALRLFVLLVKHRND